MQALLEKGADVNAEEYHSTIVGLDTALMGPSFFGREEIVALLIAKGADVNAKGGITGETALMWASGPSIYSSATLHDRKEVVQMLLAKGAGVNAMDKHGNTALIYSSKNGYKGIEELLIKAGSK